jgi:tripartite-type tricarboxylate transporter receptor subunit TctC
LKGLVLGALAASLGFVSTATAQVFPSRPITMIVPFPAGGPNDTIGRIVPERMRASLGQPIVIENVPGANGTIGTGRVARAAADGYTLSMGSFNSHVVNGAIYALPYDVLKDFAPVALIASSGGSVIVGRKTLPADDLKGLIAWLKANPGKALAGTPGVGSSTQVHGVFLQSLTGTSFTQVPYRGAAPAMQDLVAGQIDIMIERIPACRRFARAPSRRSQSRPSAASRRTRHSDRRRGRIARVLYLGLVRDVGAKGDA